MKILIYSDSKEFGGHEIMTARMANALSMRHEMYLLFRNEQFEKILSERVKKARLKLGPNWSYGGLGSYNPLDIYYLMRILKDIKPDMVIISQGMVEHGLKCAWASKLLSIRTISYIPLCFSFKSIGAACGKLRDLISILYYNLFDAFITVSEEQEGLIRAILRTRKPVYVLNNFVDMEWVSVSSVKQKPQSDILRIGIIGRIDFRQKAQDKTIEIAKELRSRQFEFKFIIVGDGKDMGRLVDMINENNLENYFVFKGWLNSTEEIYSDLDVVLMTSHFEGLPLVLLEALLFKVMVLAPDMGIFKEYLDSDFLYKNYSDVTKALLSIDLLKERFQKKVDYLRNNIQLRHNADAFANAAMRIIADIQPM